MGEGSPEKPTFKVIEGGKAESSHQSTWDKWKEAGANIQRLATIRKLSPALDRYLANPPIEREEKQLRMADIRNELSKLSRGQGLHSEIEKRTTERIGKRPPSGTHQFSWRDHTDEQVAWDEQYMLERAALIAERMAAIADHEQKLQEFEDHLSAEAAKAYPEDQRRDE